MPIDNNGRVRPDVKPGARVYRSTTQSITGGTPAAITFDTAVYDYGSCWDGSTKLIIPRKGRYQFNLTLGIAAAAHTQLTVQIQINGNTVMQTLATTGGFAVSATTSGLYKCTIGDFVQAVINHNALGAVNAATNPAFALTAQWVAER